MKKQRTANVFGQPVLLLWLLLQSVAGWAQVPYELRWPKEAVLLGTGAASLVTSYELGRRLTPLDRATIQRLDCQDVNAFDRGATYRWSPSAYRLSDVTNIGGFAAVGLVTLPTLTRKNWATVPVMFIETVLLVNGVHRSVKSAVKRSRPYAYNPDVSIDEKVTKETRRSFFSGHASNTFASAVFASEVFRHYFPDSRLKPVVWGGTLMLASATALFRYRAGLHYPTDLLMGAAFGSLVGWGIPRLHQPSTRSAFLKQITIEPWSNGLASGLHIGISINSISCTPAS